MFWLLLPLGILLLLLCGFELLCQQRKPEPGLLVCLTGHQDQSVIWAADPNVVILDGEVDLDLYNLTSNAIDTNADTQVHRLTLLLCNACARCALMGGHLAHQITMLITNRLVFGLSQSDSV